MSNPLTAANPEPNSAAQIPPAARPPRPPASGSVSRSKDCTRREANSKAGSWHRALPKCLRQLCRCPHVSVRSLLVSEAGQIACGKGEGTLYSTRFEVIIASAREGWPTPDSRRAGTGTLG